MTAETFKIEVLPMKNRLFRFALRLLANVMEAEDAVQEVMLRLWDKRESLGKVRNREAFAMTMIRNFCLDRMKSKGYNNKQPNQLEYTPSNDPNPMRDLENKDSFALIRQIIAGLPGQQRMVIHLRDIEGYDFEEISEILGVGMNAIRANLSRARKKVRDQLSKSYDYEYREN